jgi:hypothetical protein
MKPAKQAIGNEQWKILGESRWMKALDADD